MAVGFGLYHCDTIIISRDFPTKIGCSPTNPPISTERVTCPNISRLLPSAVTTLLETTCNSRVPLSTHFNSFHTSAHAEYRHLCPATCPFYDPRQSSCPCSGVCFNATHLRYSWLVFVPCNASKPLLELYSLVGYFAFPRPYGLRVPAVLSKLLPRQLVFLLVQSACPVYPPD